MVCAVLPLGSAALFVGALPMGHLPLHSWMRAEEGDGSARLALPLQGQTNEWSVRAMAKHAYVPGAKIGRHGRVSAVSTQNVDAPVRHDDEDRIMWEHSASSFEPSHAPSQPTTSPEPAPAEPQSPSITADLTQPLESVPLRPEPAAPRYGQYGQAPQEAPRSVVPPTPVFDTREEPASFRSWLGAVILASIPFVNIVALIVYAFGRTRTTSQRNWAKALLVWAVIVSLASVFLAYIGILHPSQWSAIL